MKLKQGGDHEKYYLKKKLHGKILQNGHFHEKINLFEKKSCIN